MQPSRRSCLHASLALLSCVLLSACGAAGGDSPPEAASPSSEVPAQHIVDLVEQKLITTRITGIGMDSLALNVRNTSAQMLQVEIPAGTYFVARNPQVQNMVARGATSFTLEPLQMRDIQIEAACANVRRAEPGSTDTFGILRASEQPELGKLIATLNSARVLYPVEQAAIWIVTDDASYDDLGMLVGGSRYGEALIGENEALRAMMLVSRSGLDITTYAVWAERDKLALKVSEADLIAWLAGQRAASTQVVATAVAASPHAGASGEVITQWASKASASAELSSTDGSASQLTGAPNSTSCGHQATAWSSGGTNPGATLTLWYDRAVVPSQIVIYETYNPGAVFYVEVRDQFAGEPFQVYQGNAAVNPQCPHHLTIDVSGVPVGVNMVEISVDQSLGWTEIDAVSLTGTAP